jgi:hypothetical protein
MEDPKEVASEINGAISSEHDVEEVDGNLTAISRNLSPGAWIRMGVVVAVVVCGYGLLTHFGIFAGSIGNSLDDSITRSYAPIYGQGVSVTCPPNQKFYAGANFLCDVAGVDSTGIMPDLKYVNIIVGVHNLYHMQPISG